MTVLQRIVICDDDEDRARNDWAFRLEQVPGLSDVFEIVPLTAFEFTEALAALEQRAVRARESKPATAVATDAASKIDAADVLIVDFDLTPDPDRPLDQDPSREEKIRSGLRAESGESVGYLARCYSTCKIVVAINQIFKRRTFDLTLQRFVQSYADLNISDDVLDSPELWTGEGGGFHPWLWPRLIDAAKLFQRRVSFVDLDKPILDSLGLNVPILRRALDIRQLDPLGDNPYTITFREIARSPELGLRGRDRQEDENALRRIAAAAVGRWLESVVLPAQNVIVDAPHLIQRFPSLLAGDPDDRSAWDSTTTFEEPRLGLRTEELAIHRIAACEWFQRPTWSWSGVSGDPKIAEVTAPWGSRGYAYVFCEDISRFRPLDEAVEVETDVPGPYTQRFVARLDSPMVDYHPRARLLA